jgi:hypothetical protein
MTHHHTPVSTSLFVAGQLFAFVMLSQAQSRLFPRVTTAACRLVENVNPLHLFPRVRVSLVETRHLFPRVTRLPPHKQPAPTHLFPRVRHSHAHAPLSAPPPAHTHTHVRYYYKHTHTRCDGSVYILSQRRSDLVSPVNEKQTCVKIWIRGQDHVYTLSLTIFVILGTGRRARVAQQESKPTTPLPYGIHIEWASLSHRCGVGDDRVGCRAWSKPI